MHLTHINIQSKTKEGKEEKKEERRRNIQIVLWKKNLIYSRSSNITFEKKLNFYINFKTPFLKSGVIGSWKEKCESKKNKTNCTDDLEGSLRYFKDLLKILKKIKNKKDGGIGKNISNEFFVEENNGCHYE